jgi:hypothetical protein
MIPALRDWIRSTTGLDDFDLAAVLIDDLHIMDQARENLENTFAGHNFADSFDRNQVVLSLEVLTQQHLIELQRWLASRCCRINSYHVIIIGEPGISQWWQNYSDVMNLRSFRIIEVVDLPFGSESLRKSWPKTHSWFREFWYADIPDTADLDRDLRHHFLYLPGGSPNSLEPGLYKDYLACRLLDLPGGLVDLRYGLSEADCLASWVDCESGWIDQQAVDEIRELRQQHGSQHDSPVIYDTDLYVRTLPLYAHTFATVARESLMTQPWSCLGEKTLRPFMLGQFVIPTTLDAVSRLEDLGFWFDHAWFDFDYQKERDVIKRTRQLLRSLADLVQRPLMQCSQHLQDNRSRYQANSLLARQLTEFYSA